MEVLLPTDCEGKIFAGTLEKSALGCWKDWSQAEEDQIVPLCPNLQFEPIKVAKKLNGTQALVLNSQTLPGLDQEAYFHRYKIQGYKVNWSKMMSKHFVS